MQSKSKYKSITAYPISITIASLTNQTKRSEWLIATTVIIMSKLSTALELAEAVYMEMDGYKSLRIFKVILLVILALLMLGTVVFNNSLLNELSFMAQMLLYSSILFAILAGDRLMLVPSKLELNVFEDHLVLTRNNRPVNKTKFQKEVHTIYFKDLVNCVYKSKSNQMVLQGVIHTLIYDYNKDGSLKSSPSVNKTETTQLYINFKFEENFEFTRDIAQLIPITFKIESKK